MIAPVSRGILAGTAWLLLTVPSLGQNKGEKHEDLPAPTHANVSYGKHERNVFDLWLPKSDQPTPLVLYIHGGGFFGGDKRAPRAVPLKKYLEAGWAVAALNYRLTNTAPAPAAYLDCARALQHLRHNAKQWNLDATRVASTGGSAGAGTSMWLAFHEDLADPQSPDPVARQSTRLTCVAVHDGQCSYDPRFAEKIGIPRPNWERTPFFLPFYGITPDEIDTPKAYERYEEAAPITYLTKDDVPALLTYRVDNEKVTEKTSLDVIAHHPLFGIALKKEMDKLGIECVVQYRNPGASQVVQEPPADGPLISRVDFIRKHFEAAANSRRLSPIVSASVAANAALQTDIEYGKAGGVSLRLDALVPEGPGPFPAVILVHGGAWKGGDKSGGPEKGYMAPMHEPLSAAGFAWFSINYRLAPDHRHPAAVEDVETAIRWVKAHAAEYRIDPRRLALSGESAGGHLIAMAVVRADDSTRVAAVVPFYGVFDMVAETKRLNGAIPNFKRLLGRDTLDDTMLKLMHDASPIHFVKPGLPPFLLVHGTADQSVAYEQSVQMQARLRAAGVSCDLITIKDGPHGMLPWPRLAPDFKDRVVAWLRATLPAASPSKTPNP